MRRRTVGRGLLVAPLAAVLLAGCTTSSTASPTPTGSDRATVVVHTSATPYVRDGRYTTPFSLDGGGLVVVPVAASYVPTRSLASVRAQAWATSQVAPFAPYVVGLGNVTIRRRSPGVRSVHHLVAWVALADSSGITSCPAEILDISPRVHPPSAGWGAVVIGDAPGSPAVVYQSEAIGCETLRHASVETATEVISTPWDLTPRGVVATAPSCSSFSESDFNSSPTSTSFRYLVTIPEDNSSPPVPRSEALPTCRSTGATTALNLSANPEAEGVVPTTLHEPTGLLRQVSPIPYSGPPTTSTSPTAIAALAHWSPAPGPGVLGYLPASNGDEEATVYSWSGRRLGHLYAGAGNHLPESDSAPALSPDGKRVLVEGAASDEVLTAAGKTVGRFNAGYDVLWANDSHHVCVLRLRSHRSAGRNEASLWLVDPGHASRVVGHVPGAGDHRNTQLVACDPAMHLAVVETTFEGQGTGVTDVNLDTGSQHPAAWYRSDQMGTVEIAGDGRFAATDAGTVVSTSSGKVVGRVEGQPIAISWLGHVVVVLTDGGQRPEVVDWTTHRVVWRYTTSARRCPCGSIWVIASRRMNSDDVALSVPVDEGRAAVLWVVTFRGSAQHAASVVLLRP